MTNNQCLDFALFSLNIVEFEMTADRLIFLSRSIALLSAVISCCAVDDLNDDVMSFRTLRVRF